MNFKIIIFEALAYLQRIFQFNSYSPDKINEQIVEGEEHLDFSNDNKGLFI